MNTNQSFQYTGSSEFKINGVSLEANEIALFNELTGEGGIGYIPYDGATVSVYVPIDKSSFIKDLEPSLNNKVYYLVSDVLYDDTQKDIIISLATEIPMVLMAGKYEGSFVFNNPNNYENLYLIWDYTDSLTSGYASYSGAATERYINIPFPDERGISGVNYNTVLKPVRYILSYNDRVIQDTGYVGLNTLANYNNLISAGISPSDINLVFPYDGLVDNGSGSIEFFKSASTDDESVLYVHSPLVNSSWNISRIDPYLKTFYIDTTDGDPTNVCSQTANVAMYHNGLGLYPVTGDQIFTDSTGLSPYNGNNAYHLISDVSMAVPPVSGGLYGLVGENGVVNAFAGCDCLEYAVPFIFQEDIVITQGVFINVPMQASNNPTEWRVLGSCDSYTFTSGDTGSIFDIVDCYGNNKRITVGTLNSESITTCSSTTPILVLGNGTYTLNKACLDFYLPKGLSFNYTTGEIFGTPEEACSYDITLRASNCLGYGGPKTINITVETGIKLTPFAIDVENFGDTGDAACAVSPIYTLLYHDGNGRVPDINDNIYIDYKATTKFMGGSQWYKIDHSTYSIKVCETGTVCDKNECPSVTTTTTSTTTTTTTTTLPTGDWFTATLCPDGLVIATLVDTTTSGFIVGDYVKTTDGNCWEITATTTASYPYVLIDNTVGPYGDCATCLNITTTTTTTTTTTAPVFTAFSMDPDRQLSAYNACANSTGPLSTYYHNGTNPYPVVNDFVYTNSIGTIPLAGGNGWYYFFDGAAYAMQVASTGQVLLIVACSGVTTTTTTTTLPTTYYLARQCGGIGSLVLISYQSFSTLSPLDIVKCANNVCYEIVISSSPGVAVSSVLFTYDNCVDCTGITTTTTTSTTTTSTTTTTTTTTTTAAPPVSSFFRHGDQDVICESPIAEFFIDGAVGSIGNSIYEYVLGVYVLAPANYYLQLATTVAYEWDGTNWTGNSTLCV
jgi:hypothetical protein